MTRAELRKLEATIVEACEWVQENGWRLVGAGSFGDVRDNTCCALGAVAVQHGYAPSAVGVCEASWEVSDIRLISSVGSFAAGFDGDQPIPRYYRAQYNMGRRIRERFGVGQ